MWYPWMPYPIPEYWHSWLAITPYPATTTDTQNRRWYCCDPVQLDIFCFAVGCCARLASKFIHLGNNTLVSLRPVTFFQNHPLLEEESMREIQKVSIHVLPHVSKSTTRVKHIATGTSIHGNPKQSPCMYRFLRQVKWDTHPDVRNDHIIMKYLFLWLHLSVEVE